MSKYLVTLEIESERELDQLIKPVWGAFMINPDEWKVIHTEGIEE